LTFYGEKATPPGSGGDGGIGGNEGLPGKWTFFGESETLPIIDSSKVVDGSNGRGGPNGPCTRDGKYYETTLRKYGGGNWLGTILTAGAAPPYSYKIEPPNTYKTSPCMESSSGITGGNKEGQIQSQIMTVDFHLSKQVYTVQLLKDQPTSNLLLETRIGQALNKIWTDPKILQLETFSTLLSEFCSIEDKSLSELAGSTSVSPLSGYYEVLLTRISHVGIRQSLTEQDRIGLGWLYTTTLTKVINLNQRPLVIRDLLTYFESLKSRAIEVVEHNRFKAISEQNVKFNNQTNDMIAQGNQFVRDEILPSIRTIEEKITSFIVKLANDTADSANRAKMEVEKLKIQRNEVIQQAPLRVLFSVLKVVGTVASVFGPIGAGVGTLVTASSNIGGSFLKPLSIEPIAVKHFDDIYGSVEGALDEFEPQIKEYSENKITDLQAQIDTLQDLAKSFPDNFTDVEDSLKRNTQELEELSTSDTINTGIDMALFFNN